jgi:hypothetical protein
VAKKNDQAFYYQTIMPTLTERLIGVYALLITGATTGTACFSVTQHLWQVQHREKRSNYSTVAIPLRAATNLFETVAVATWGAAVGAAIGATFPLSICAIYRYMPGSGRGD